MDIISPSYNNKVIVFSMSMGKDNIKIAKKQLCGQKKQLLSNSRKFVDEKGINKPHILVMDLFIYVTSLYAWHM